MQQLLRVCTTKLRKLGKFGCKLGTLKHHHAGAIPDHTSQRTLFAVAPATLEALQLSLQLLQLTRPQLAATPGYDMRRHTTTTPRDRIVNALVICFGSCKGGFSPDELACCRCLPLLHLAQPARARCSTKSAPLYQYRLGGSAADRAHLPCHGVSPARAARR